jgi:hypothetical protein
MTRTSKIFDKEGIAIRPFPVDFMVIPSQKIFSWPQLIPSGSAMEKWNLLLKEWLGIIAISLQRTSSGT